MKARNFRYIRPDSLEQAYQVLAEAGPDAVPVATAPLATAPVTPAAPELVVTALSRPSRTTTFE